MLNLSKTLVKLNLLLMLIISSLCSPALMAQTNQNLVVCTEGDPNGFNPELYIDGTTFDASSETVYNTLVAFKPGTTEVIPSLATDWHVSKDGLTYTFDLRKGVQFHSNPYFKPSRDFNADDVVFTFNHQLNKNNRYYSPLGGNNPGYRYFSYMGMDKLIKSIKAKGAYQVVFTLNQPNATFISDLAMGWASILSAEYAKKMVADKTPQYVNLYPVGTGPFEFKQYQRGAIIRFQRFQDYWQGPAQINQLIFSITTDASVRLAKLQANECQVALYPNINDINSIKSNPQLKLLSRTALTSAYIAYNTAYKEPDGKPSPLNNQQVRQALTMAIDKQAIVNAVYQGQAQIGSNFIPPTLWSFNKAVKPYLYNVEKAKQLLAKAGYPKGFNTDIYVPNIQRPYLPSSRQAAEIIQGDWAKIGVKARIVTLEWGAYLNAVKNGNHQTTISGWVSDNGDPDNFFGLVTCNAIRAGVNYARFCDPQLDKLLSQARTTSDRQQRIKLYEQVQVLMHQKAAFDGLAYNQYLLAMRSNVQGYKMDPLGLHNFYGVHLTN
jgi:dipeptide transport system substrate-binding protein